MYLHLFVPARSDVTHATCAGNVDCPTLPAACEFGFVPLCKFLVETCGADVNERSLCKWNTPLEAKREGCPSGGLTPLHQAVFSGKAELVRMLLKHGADTRKRSLGRSATLPVEFWNFNVRVADIILRWEEEHLSTEGPGGEC